MVDVRAFHALRPAPGAAARVLSPPYDVVDVAEARAWVGGERDSFLRISRPEVDLDAAVDPHTDEVYALGRRNLDDAVARGVLVRDAVPTLSVYRQRMGQVVQTGVVGAVSVADYDAGRVRTHEHTRPDKELDRVRHIEALDAHDEPVFLLSRRSPDVDALVARVVGRQPAVDLVSRDGVGHTLWVVDDPAEVDALRLALARVGYLYVADGHHRSAAASRVHAARAGTAGEHDAFLAIVLPLDDVHVMAYHRVVADLAGRDVAAFLDAVGEAFEPVADEAAATHPARHAFGMYVDGTWWVLRPRAPIEERDVLARLDVSVLQDRLLAPVLGIGDPRTDPRIAFVGGIRGPGEVARLVDEGRAAVGFVLHPTSTAELVAVADAGLVMPPKSTWFEPKLGSGLVVHPLH